VVNARGVLIESVELQRAATGLKNSADAVGAELQAPANAPAARTAPVGSGAR
jgi:hypothetical protein